MKIGIISQARMTSTRLPGKVLKEINGIPLLKYHIDRAMQSGYQLYIATTTNATDEPIVDFCKKENIPYYRGSENHVLSRYYGCAREHELDIIIRITSDCPLIDGALIKKALEKQKNAFGTYDYISNCIKRSYPRGFDFEIFSFEYLQEAYETATLPSDIEHVTPYIHQNRSNQTNFQHIVHSSDKSQYRITVDTPEDFELIEKLIKDHQAQNLPFNKIINILDEHPELVAINAHIEQKKL